MFRSHSFLCSFKGIVINLNYLDNKSFIKYISLFIPYNKVVLYNESNSLIIKVQIMNSIDIQITNEFK